MIKQKLLDKLDKTKIYCKYCLDQDDAITELIWDEKNNKYKSCEKHNKNVHSHIIKYDKERNKWCTYRGKGLNSYFISEIETDKDIQEKYLNCRYIYIDVKTLDSSIFMEKIDSNINNSKIFYISKFLNGINYIHANSKDPFIIHKVRLYGYCNFKECNKKFYFNELSNNMCEYGEHFCCPNHALQHRNKSEKMRKSASERMTEWHKTKEGKKFTLNHYKKLGNSNIAKENLKIGREKAKETWIGSDKQKEHLKRINKINNKDPKIIKIKAHTRKNNQAIKEGYKSIEDKENKLKLKEKKLLSIANNYGYKSIKDYNIALGIAKRLGYNNLDDYKKYLKEKEIEKQKEKDKINILLSKYGFKDYLSYSNKLKSIKRLGFNTIEEYNTDKLRKLEEENKKKNELLNLAEKYGYKNYKGCSIELAYAKKHGFNSGNKEKDLENYRNWKIKNNINKHEHIILTEEEFKLFKKIISDVTVLDNRLKERNICGVYCIVIDGYPFYFGESLNIFTRYFSHVKNMIRYPQNFDNIINDILNNVKDPLTGKMRTLSLKVVKELDISKFNIKNNKKDKKILKKILKTLEKECINKFKPFSQKCDQTDHIIRDINSRGNYEDYKNNYNKDILNNFLNAINKE